MYKVTDQLWVWVQKRCPHRVIMSMVWLFHIWHNSSSTVVRLSSDTLVSINAIALVGPG